MNPYPKVKSVQPLKGRHLLVTFCNGVQKIYDCTPLIEEEAFKPLNNEALFKTVKADKSGYGISWDDEIDLSESELWIHGILAEQGA